METALTSRADRRRFLQGSVALGGASLLGGCASAGRGPVAALGFREAERLPPLKLAADRIMGITVCLRPFRAAGPRIEVETLGDKRVVHNYGHGGSGWSLGWGSAQLAVGLALTGGVRDVAVIGCGALGLTAATTAQRAGARVTIYAKERLPEARSARATGVWSPDSRIALSANVDAGFADRWEAMARTTFRTHQQYLGLADAPVEWTDRYIVSDGPSPPRSNPMGFAHYEERIADLTPRTVTLGEGAHPFGARRVRRASLPMYNVAAYGRVLTNDFLLAGGRFEMREFHAPSELAGLREPVIINCTGYGARALWKDESLVPVRGQIAWLIPQPEAKYGVNYDGVSSISRRDGLAVQVTGADESWGYGDANETVDRAESERGVAALARLFPS